jgi:hypothetical protein
MVLMPGGQSRLASILEALANIVVGVGVAFIANLMILPAFGLPVSLGQAAGISAAFTAVSLVRSYVLRRIFNGITVRCSNGRKFE